MFIGLPPDDESEIPGIDESPRITNNEYEYEVTGVCFDDPNCPKSGTLIALGMRSNHVHPYDWTLSPQGHGIKITFMKPHGPANRQTDSLCRFDVCHICTSAESITETANE